LCRARPGAEADLADMQLMDWPPARLSCRVAVIDASTQQQSKMFGPIESNRGHKKVSGNIKALGRVEASMPMPATLAPAPCLRQ
jgi:hypothetical protein